MERRDVEYVLPLRWHDDSGLPELTTYLAELSEVVDVTVIDSSAPHLFDSHRRAWAGVVRHLAPQPWPGRNGKVRNVVTGIRAARHPVIMIADDDVRYTPAILGRGLGLMLDGDADLLVPQNVFTEWPWHARWDTARQLVNRAFGGDYPGTFFLRRASLGGEGYEGDVLFENLELMRTVAGRGGVVRQVPNLYVGRQPPTAKHFWSQRVRQAYDNFAQPGRLAVETSLLPLVLLAGRRRAPVIAALATAAAMAAEVGRRRDGGADIFPLTAALWAPVWLAERAVCMWVAIGLRLAGGIRYGDGRIRHAATPRRHHWRPRVPSPSREALELSDTNPRPSITPYPNGPLILRGDFDLRTVDGEAIPHRDGPVALCRCGLSSIKPFCDSTHKPSKFRAE